MVMDQSPSRQGAESSRLTVVKVGGGLSSTPEALRRVGGALAEAARQHAIVVVPGGGPFAEQVRAFDRAHHLSADAAHWMAILAMDLYGAALADQTPGSRLVEDRAGALAALAAGAVPILQPSRWLRATDELPHSWDVTSDSLAAYLAMLLGAEALVLIKPVAGGTELLDPYFSTALAAGMTWSILAIDEIEALSSRLTAAGR